MVLWAWASQVAPMVKNPPANAGDSRDTVRSLGQENPLEEGMATHSSIFAWRIPGTEEPGGLQSMGSQTWLKWLSMHAHIAPLKQGLKNEGQVAWEDAWPRKP